MLSPSIELQDKLQRNICFSNACEKADSSAAPQNDILIPSREVEEGGLKRDPALIVATDSEISETLEPN
jgi:hypothetical protein